MMKWEPFEEVKDCGMLHYDRFGDERGFFQELYNRKACIKAGAPFMWSWAQDNVSYSHAGVLRGFHVQKNNPQGKLVTCLLGKIMDVCLDVRPGSPTFMKMTRVILDGEHPSSFYLPPGTAHAFIAMTDAMIHYRCTTEYDKDSDGGINAMSPEVSMVWPPGQWIRSEKDRQLPSLVDYLNTIA